MPSSIPPPPPPLPPPLLPPPPPPPPLPPPPSSLPPAAKTKKPKQSVVAYWRNGNSGQMNGYTHSYYYYYNRRTGLGGGGRGNGGGSTGTAVSAATTFSGKSWVRHRRVVLAASAATLLLYLVALYERYDDTNRVTSYQFYGPLGLGCNCHEADADSSSSSALLSSSSSSSSALGVFLLSPAAAKPKPKRKKKIAVVTFSDAQTLEGWTDPTIVSIVRCTRLSKMKYAQMHGYHYLDQKNFSSYEALPLLEQHLERPEKYLNLRFLIQMMDRHRSIEWFLWINPLAMITDKNTTIEQKLQTFQALFEEQENQRQSRVLTRDVENVQEERKGFLDKKSFPESYPPLSMILATDHLGYHNDGVFFIRNNEIGRRILYTTFMTYVQATPVLREDISLSSVSSLSSQDLDYYAYHEALHALSNDTSVFASVLRLPVEQAHLLQNYRRNGLRKNSTMYWSREKRSFVLNLHGAQVRYQLGVLRKEVRTCPWL